MDLCILISLGPVIMQCNCYLFCCSNCSSFGHWELFQVGSCLWGHFDPFLFPLSFWQVNHEPMVAHSSKYLTLIFFFLKKAFSQPRSCFRSLSSYSRPTTLVTHSSPQCVSSFNLPCALLLNYSSGN